MVSFGNCMKCKSLFSGKSKKTVINLSFAEYSQKVVKIKVSEYLGYIR